ncbi:chemotaxis protein CheB [Pseudoduganella chitinolytica]|uniref:protein-glutamate methylesterase n=1 Tax=Pseudoduganella chitinolytica TaxID=34070 RepID=A0ABY8BG73_9BURK|nr:chemotaxis protein CheB [Pseudoduganella chitinolytica]WEF33966.1 chemotaxis protein CheB [Pseudoduganella chitinolytica]
MIELTTVPADEAIVIGTSTGGLHALQTVIAGLPLGLPAAVLIVMHTAEGESLLPALLARVARMPLRHARDGEPVLAGRILVAPPGQHLMVERTGAGCRAVLTRGPKENYCRPAIDVLFRSAAAAYGPRATGVVLTGQLDDGTMGLLSIKTCGGRAVVQLPEDAVAPSMPASALQHVDVDKVLRLPEIAGALTQMVGGAVPAVPAATPTPEWIQLENRYAGKGSDMDSLARIATPSTFTCPECQGTLWEVRSPGLKRYRCHTGHALTEQTLASLQDRLVEDALSSALRALHEKEKLLRQMAEDAVQAGQAKAALDHVQQAAEAQRSAEVLHRLITARHVADGALESA